jgi:hypothetical protein
MTMPTYRYDTPVTVNDSRKLAACIVRPLDNLYYNWTTDGWESVFVTASHLKTLTPMQPSGLFSTVQTVDIGDTLVEQTDAALLLVSVDGTGAPIAVVDCWTLPSPTPPPVVGGFLLR